MLIKVATHDTFENSFKLYDHCEAVGLRQLSYMVSSWDSLKETIQILKFNFDVFSMHITPYIENYLETLTENSAGKEPFKITAHEDPVDANSSYRHYFINHVTFQREGLTYCVLFDKVAYVCNDSGKTLERLDGGGVINSGNRPAISN